MQQLSTIAQDAISWAANKARIDSAGPSDLRATQGHRAAQMRFQNRDRIR